MISLIEQEQLYDKYTEALRNFDKVDDPVKAVAQLTIVFDQDVAIYGAEVLRFQRDFLISFIGVREKRTRQIVI